MLGVGWAKDTGPLRYVPGFVSVAYAVPSRTLPWKRLTTIGNRYASNRGNESLESKVPKTVRTGVFRPDSLRDVDFQKVKSGPS